MHASECLFITCIVQFYMRQVKFTHIVLSKLMVNICNLCTKEYKIQKFYVFILTACPSILFLVVLKCEFLLN